MRLGVDGVEQARKEVDRIVRQRRRSFAWCRCCRGLTPPELTHERGYCMGCAAATQGTVY
ncbi:hypothetical protein [Nocardioides taihuensis]|uniref:DksA C4-type domain-containing protein n=1 Tax=Nocardioides taihuensis TaxID=1835606 RepID=A0ABW0BKW6_9ACTN